MVTYQCVYEDLLDSAYTRMSLPCAYQLDCVGLVRFVLALPTA